MSIKNISRYTAKKPIKQPEIIITKEVIEKFNYLHRRFPSIEWSCVGTLQILEGNLQNMGSGIVMKLIDIYPLSADTATWTGVGQSSNDIRYVKAVAMIDGKNEIDDINYTVCTIHTHHSMQTFFSETDMKDVEDQCDLRFPNGLYISLITNLRRDHIAKIGFCIEKEERTIYSTFRETKLEFENKEASKRKCLITYDVKVVEEGGTSYDESFLRRVKNVEEFIAQKKAAQKTKVQPVRRTTPGITRYQDKLDIDKVLDKPKRKLKPISDQQYYSFCCYLIHKFLYSDSSVKVDINFYKHATPERLEYMFEKVLDEDAKPITGLKMNINRLQVNLHKEINSFFRIRKIDHNNKPALYTGIFSAFAKIYLDYNVNGPSELLAIWAKQWKVYLNDDILADYHAYFSYNYLP